MELKSALAKLVEPSSVSIQSSSYLVGSVNKKSKMLDAERKRKQLATLDRKPRLVPVDKSEHGGELRITPWELLHTLGRATTLSGNGSSRALAQHWACLKYITALQANGNGRMELSGDGKDPTYHRKSVQAEDLGIAFALAVASRIVRARHPDYTFEIADADVALEAGWALRGTEVKSRQNTKLRPDYFLIGFKEGSPARVVTVECKGSHGPAVAQHEQLAKAAAQVNSIVIGDTDRHAAVPPSLMIATALAGRTGVEMRILDPEGDGVLALPDDMDRTPALNGPVQELREIPGVPIKDIDGLGGTRPGFHIPREKSEWFSKVLARTAAAELLAFAGDRAGAKSLLTPRQQQRVGAVFQHPSVGVSFDASVTIGGLTFVGTDNVFRFGPQRIEAFSGIPEGIHRMLVTNQDVQGYHSALPTILNVWAVKRRDAEADWGGIIAMDSDGAILGLRAMGSGSSPIEP